MACDLTFNVKGLSKSDLVTGLYTIHDLNLSNYPDSSELEISVKELLKSKNKDKLNKIIAAIKNSLLSGAIHTKYDDNCRYIPNYSGNALVEAFPDISWGTNVPNVLLVNSNSGITPRNNGAFLSRILQYNSEGELSEMYIVPIDLIENFAAHTRAISNTDKISSLEELPENASEEQQCEYERLKAIQIRIKNLLEQIIAAINSNLLLSKFRLDRHNKIIAAIKSLISSLEKTLNARNNSDKVLLDHKDKLEKLKLKQINKDDYPSNTEYIDAINALEQDISYEERRIEEINRIKSEIPQQLYSWVKMYLKLISDLEYTGLIPSQITIDTYTRYLEELESKYDIQDKETDMMTNEKISKHNDAIKAYDQSKLPNTTDPKKFILEILLDYNNYTDKLTYEMRAEISDIVKLLANHDTSMSSSIPVVNTINWHLELNNGIIDKAFLKLYFIQKGFCDENVDDSTLYMLLKRHFLENQDKYYLLSKDFNTSKIKLRTHKSLVLLELGFMMSDNTPFSINRINSNNLLIVANTITSIKPTKIKLNSEDEGIDTYKGFYLYQIRGKYFYSRDPLHVYTKAKLFDSPNEMIAYIDEHFNNINLGNEIFLHSATDSSTAVRTPTGRFYKAGQLIKSINYPKGKFNIPLDFRIYEFKRWVETTFDSNIARIIFDKLQTPEQMALFYTYYREGVNYYYDSGTYSDLKEDIIKRINDISSAENITYMVSDNTFTEGPIPKPFLTDHRKFYTRIYQIDTSEPKAETVIPSRQLQIVDWKSILLVFKNHGINMQLLSEKEILDMGFKHGNKAFMQGGIIYINTDRASMGDAFHEYTHILLGIVALKNKQAYASLLKAFQEKFKLDVTYKSVYEAKERDYADLINNLKSKGKSNEEIELFLLEEIFADLYGLYLLNNNLDMNEIFDLISDEVINDPFNNLTKDSLVNHAKSRFDIMFQFSSEMLRARSVQGFGLTLNQINKKEFDKLEKLIPSTTKDILFNNMDTKDTGLYKYCN